MSLDEIATLLGAHSAGKDWRPTVHDRLAAIDRQLCELHTARRYLAHLLECSAEHGLERCRAYRESVALPLVFDVTS